MVGVDGSRGSRKALNWAAAEAADHGADLVVVNVWERALPPAVGSVPTEDDADPGESAAEELIQIIKEELGEEPAGLAQPGVKHGRPAGGVLEQATNAHPLGGGTRGPGGIARPGPGS